MIETLPENVPTLLHLRFEGRSDELSLESLGLDSGSSDRQIKQAVAAHLDRPIRALDGYVVVRHQAAIVVRPEAIYG